MKNEELIKRLKEFNPKADVSLVDCNDITVSYISEDGDTKETTRQIFIEAENICESCGFHDGGGYCIAYSKPIEDVEECFQYLEE